MAQRNTLCTHQMLDLQLGQGVDHFHPNHCILSGNIAEYTNQSLHPAMPASGSTSEQCLLFRDHLDRSVFYGNQYDNFQTFHAVPNLGLSAAMPSNFYGPVFPSSSGNFPAPRSNGSVDHLPPVIGMDEFGRNNQFIDNLRGHGKRKNAEVPPGSQHHINGSSSSSSSSAFLSLNCGVPQWHSLEPVVDLSESRNFEHPEHQESGNIQAVEGSHRSVRSRPGVAGFQPEPVYFLHPTHGIQAAHMGQSLHPASNVWIAQFGMENNINNGACSNWNYNHPVGYLHGGCLHSGAFEPANVGMQAFPHASSSANAVVLFNPPSLPNFHQHLSPAWTIPLQGYGYQAQTPAPSYPHLLNTLHPVDVNPSVHGSRFPHFPFNDGQISWPRHTQHAAPDFRRESVGILSSEDAAVMDVTGSYGAANVTDQHQDMRLDIDEMSYEELLALEEQIGDVRTGLTEECIINNLKTGVHNSQTFQSSDESPEFSEEAEACIICQVEYEEDEITGTLDCGHSYHGDCIKQWLLVKNLCPICKKTALKMENSKG